MTKQYNMLSRGVKAALFTLISGIGAQQAMAAGFALNDHSATASGNALAGAAASKSDISFSFWNPALLSNAKKMELYVSGAILVPKMDVTVNSASDAAGNTLTGNAPSDVVNTSFIPSVYFAYPVSEKTTIGAAFNAPFGLSGKYGKEWAGRYHSAETAVQDLSISLSIAQKINEMASVGASVQVHSGSVLLAANLSDFAGGNSAAGDGYGELEADDISYAFSVGAALEPIKGTRFGIGYRSEVEYTFEGDSDYSNVSPILAGLGVDEAYLFDEITFPSVLTISAEQDIGNRVTIGATAMKTGWGVLDEMRIAFAPGPDGIKQPDSVLTFDFGDEWYYSTGITYLASEQLTLRTGFAIDNSPAKEAYRSARTPDGDRKWFSLGASYKLASAGEITVAYTHVSIDDVSVTRTGQLEEDASRGSLDADYETSADVLSLAYNMSF